MNFRVVSALIWRYLFLYTRTPMRLVELIFWPMVDLLIWGFVMLYVKDGVREDSAIAPQAFVAGAILWDVIFRAQQGVAVSFLEDVWTRNLLNVFVAPVRTAEYLAATFGVGILRIAVTVLMMALVAFMLDFFNIFTLGWHLLPFVFNLLLAGWALGMISTALIVRWGQAAESLAWAVPFFFQPFCAVFYSVEKLPTWAQEISWWVPASHVFEGMRAAMEGKPFSWPAFWTSAALNVGLLCAAGAIFVAMLSKTRKLGLLTKFATQ
jgi:ABC-2 type transport system permease protein